MCGRYSLTQRLEVLEEIFKAQARALRLKRAVYNIAPSQPILAITQEEPGAIEELTWGMEVGRESQPPRLIVNAKAETLEQRPLFADALQYRRCVILADGFYEWETRAGTRYPRYYRLRNGKPFAFAGVYQQTLGESPNRRAVIITSEANALVSQTHDRMPVILSDPKQWLAAGDPKILKPFPSDAMESFPVDPIVNAPENDTEACIRPCQPKELPLF
ncbi:MAG: hypothetical protein DLM50_06545 [Candidatus Meridianibacter frigidus]|nr:MAG: hypothetical protein DLM50_06545 [Candidatus Eremiobacteraeota bacterium]